MASSDTGCGPVVIESDEDNSSQKELSKSYIIFLPHYIELLN